MKKYFTFDDEYISGWQFFLRGLIATLLAWIIIGLYLWGVNAYKRAKSLGHSENTCRIWAVWGFLILPLALTPLAFLTNTIPYWYLWRSNGPGKPMHDVLENKDPIIEYSENEHHWICVVCNTQNEMENNECIKCVEQNNLDTEGRLSS